MQFTEKSPHPTDTDGTRGALSVIITIEISVTEWVALLRQAPENELMSEAARRSRARAANRPKVLRPCGMCGTTFGSRDLRKHLTECKGPVAP